MEVESNLKIHFTTDSKLPTESELKQKIEDTIGDALYTLLYGLDVELTCVHAFSIEDFYIREEDEE